MITSTPHRARMEHINDLVYRLREDGVFDGLTTGEYSIILTLEDGFFVYGLDPLPDYVEQELERGLFQVDRPLWYWCSIDQIREQVKDSLYMGWLIDYDSKQ
jgi:hypothetical protein